MAEEKQRGLVLITYRDRHVHLECLTHMLQKHWSELTIVVIEQADNKVWNKGLLYNIGYKLLAADFDYVILHDVDFIPVPDKVDYSYCGYPCMVAGEASQFNYQLLYPTFFGGVVVCNKKHYEAINGFSNQFKGYGGEDDGMKISFNMKGITTGIKMSRFECFHHPRPNINPGSAFYNTPDYQHNLKLATSPRDFNSGISDCDNYIEDYSKEIIDGKIYIKVHTR